MRFKRLDTFLIKDTSLMRDPNFAPRRVTEDEKRKSPVRSEIDLSMIINYHILTTEGDVERFSSPPLYR